MGAPAPPPEPRPGCRACALLGRLCESCEHQLLILRRRLRKAGVWAPRRVFETTYRRTWRKHAHRCMACWRIVEEGSPVLMVRLSRCTRVVHMECSERVAEPTSGATWRQQFRAYAEGEP